MRYMLFARTGHMVRDYPYAIADLQNKTTSLYCENIKIAIKNVNQYDDPLDTLYKFGKPILDFNNLQTFQKDFPEFFI